METHYDDISSGSLIAGRFQIARYLGGGGFGSTYLAYDKTMDDKVVVKVLHEEWVKDSAARERFINDARAMRRAQHPNVVIVYDLDAANLRIIMEYLSGGSIDHMLRSGLNWEQSLKIAIQVCQGLGTAHAKGIVHRDVKPANILVQPGLSVVKIGDFGIAHLHDVSQTRAGGTHPGTLLYRAPESFRVDPSKEIDGRADLYSLGVTLYQLLTARDYLSYDECVLRAEREIRRKYNLAPDIEPSVIQMVERDFLSQSYWMQAVCNQNPPDLRESNPDLPAELAKCVMTALAKDPDERFPSADAMAESLRKIMAGLSKTAGKKVVTSNTPQISDIIARSLDAAHQNQLTTALELIQHAVSLAPTDTHALAAMASIQIARNDYSSARDTWAKILEIDPDYPDIYLKLGTCYNKLHQPEKGIEIQMQGIKKQDRQQSASLFHGLASSYYAAGLFEEAIWALEQSLKIRPDTKLKILLRSWRNKRKRSSGSPR